MYLAFLLIYGFLPLQLPPGLRTARDEHDPTDIPAAVHLIVEGTNAFRVEYKLKPVRPEAKLAKAAETFAQFLSEHGELSHEADGRHPADRATEAGYQFSALAENIAEEMRSTGFTPRELADNFLDGWKNSPGHRKNMLDPVVTQIGVGIAYNRQTDTYYAVQMFGRPKTGEIEFTITNKTNESIKYKIGPEPFSLPAKATVTHTLAAPRDLMFLWPADRVPPKGKKSLRPHDRDRITVQSDADGRFELKVESPASPPKKPARSPPRAAGR